MHLFSSVVSCLKAKYDCFHNCMADLSQLVETLIDRRTPAHGTVSEGSHRGPLRRELGVKMLRKTWFSERIVGRETSSISRKLVHGKSRLESHGNPLLVG